MYAGQLVFAQIMEHLPWRTCRRFVERYGGNYRVRDFSCANQFCCMAFAQLTYRDSRRDIVTRLRAQSAKRTAWGLGESRRRALAVAQVRAGGGGFHPSALEKGSRTGQALNLMMAEMYVQGVSTHKVIEVLQRLLGPELSITSTQVSRATEQLRYGPGGLARAAAGGHTVRPARRSL